MKRFIFLIISLMFLSSAFALDSNYLSFRITPQFTIANGVINEYVFNEKCPNTNHKESQLDWDVKNIPLFQGKAEFDILKFIRIEFNCSIALPKSSGYMQDYDWLNYLYWPQDNPRDLTNYSKHDNKLLTYTTFSVGLGANIRLPAEITITPILAYYYEYISFDGINGYKTYKIDNGEKISFSGKVISYKQEINDLLLGLAVRIETLPQFIFYADFFISPKVTSLNAMDYHYINDGTSGTAYWDSFQNIWQLYTHANAQYKFNKFHSAGISASLQYIPISTGYTRTKGIDKDGHLNQGEWSKPSIGGGTGRLIWTLGLSYSFSL